MKKIIFIAIVSALMGSCSKRIMPQAVNTTSTATYADLNLRRSDYEVINTITAEASMSVTSNYKGTKVNISGINDNFELQYRFIGKVKLGIFASDGGWRCRGTGVLKLGYLSNDYYNSFDVMSKCAPEQLARHLAIYRAINQAKQEGGDGLIEPTIATNIEQTGHIVTYKTTVTAKVIKLKVDSEL